IGRTRAEALQQMSPHLLADAYLYPTAEGGKKLTVQPGWGCPCSCSKSTEAVFYDGWPLLNAPFAPGNAEDSVSYSFTTKTLAARILQLFCAKPGRSISGKASSSAKL